MIVATVVALLSYLAERRTGVAPPMPAASAEQSQAA